MSGDASQVAEWMREAGPRGTTLLTGAGISTDSGIPDYRGPRGLWTQNPEALKTVTYDSYVSDPKVRERAWIERLESPVWDSGPNAAHLAVVAVERAELLRAVCTQNIDGLQQIAGSDPDMVLELHGTMRWVSCLECGLRTPMQEVLERVRAGESDPPCLDCGGIQKSATVAFGQSLDPSVIRAATAAARECAVLLAVGTSLTVHPAAGLCDMAKEEGARLVIINAQPTPYDAMADLVIAEPIGIFLPEVAALSSRA